MNASKFKNVTVQIDDSLLALLDEKVETLDLNRSQYIRRILKKHLGLNGSQSEFPDEKEKVAA